MAIPEEGGRSVTGVCYRRDSVRSEVVKHYATARPRTGVRGPESNSSIGMHLPANQPWFFFTLATKVLWLYDILHTALILLHVNFGSTHTLSTRGVVVSNLITPSAASFFSAYTLYPKNPSGVHFPSGYGNLKSASELGGE